jgi:hypothetical protein
MERIAPPPPTYDMRKRLSGAASVARAAEPALAKISPKSVCEVSSETLSWSERRSTSLISTADHRGRWGQEQTR